MPPSLRPLLYAHVGLTLAVGAILMAVAGVGHALSYGTGALTVAISLVGFAWSARHMLESGGPEKSVARVVGPIVTKYAVLLGLVYYVTQREWFEPLEFAAGVFAFGLAALLYAAGSAAGGLRTIRKEGS